MTVQSPIPDFAAAREAMVESQLRPQGVADPAVLQAMGRVERERFLPADKRPLAYADRSVALGGGRFLTAPAVLGQLLTQMMPLPGLLRSSPRRHARVGSKSSKGRSKRALPRARPTTRF
jgi:protein-L-isoaspartate(D-aspartate) O-methyltransferase